MAEYKTVPIAYGERRGSYRVDGPGIHFWHGEDMGTQAQAERLAEQLQRAFNAGRAYQREILREALGFQGDELGPDE